MVEHNAEGIDTLMFSGLMISVTLHLALSVPQSVHTHRTLVLNSGITFENIVGGSCADTLRGNSLGNQLTGNSRADMLFGNGGCDTLIGGIGDDSYFFAAATSAELNSVLNSQLKASIRSTLQVLRRMSLWMLDSMWDDLCMPIGLFS